MRTIGRTVRKTVGILALSAMIPVSAWAADAPQARGPRTPPQQAFDACAGKKAGDAVQFTTPRGDNVAAICREFDGKLAARPERSGRGPGWAGRGPHHRMGMGMGMGMGFGCDNAAYLSKTLNLTAEQKTKIQAVMDEERKKGEKLHEQLWDAHGRFWEAAKKIPYDEAAVRKQAADLEKIRTELMVSRAGAMNLVLSLLTPEQREKAQKEGFCGKGAGPGKGRGPGAAYGPRNPDSPMR